MSISQSLFRAAVLDPDHVVPAGLSDGTGTPARARFDVYRNNVAVGLSEALETGFPVIRALIGDENFAAISGVFLRRHPPTTPVLFLYGDAFPDFLRSFEPLSHLGYLGDVADIEMAIRRSYHAADAAPFDAAQLAAIDPEQLGDLRITLAPATRLLRSPWPIYDIWAFNSHEGHPKPQPGAQDVLITRPEFDPAPHLLPPGGGYFVQALHAGQTLGASATHAQTNTPDFDLSATLGLLLNSSAIAHI